MNNVGVSFIRLGCYEEATAMLSDAKDCLNDHPLDIQKEKLTSAAVRNLPLNTRFYDLDESLVGVETNGHRLLSVWQRRT